MIVTEADANRQLSGCRRVPVRFPPSGWGRALDPPASRNSARNLSSIRTRPPVLKNRAEVPLTNGLRTSLIKTMFSVARNRLDDVSFHVHRNPNRKGGSRGRRPRWKYRIDNVRGQFPHFLVRQRGGRTVSPRVEVKIKNGFSLHWNPVIQNWLERPFHDLPSCRSHQPARSRRSTEKPRGPVPSGPGRHSNWSHRWPDDLPAPAAR